MSDEIVAVALIPAATRDLQATADLLGLSRTDVVNRAVQAYAFLEFELSTGGELLVRRDGRCQRVRFVLEDAG